jgi:hypothetical protein
VEPPPAVEEAPPPPPVEQAEPAPPPPASVEGEPPFPVSEREVPLDSVVGPGRPYDIGFDAEADTNYSSTCCGQTIVSEVTGRPVEREEIVQRAAEGGSLVFDDAGEVRGTSVTALPDLLASYGIESHLTTGEESAWQRLDRALADGHRVVLPLGQPGYPGVDGDMAVAVTAVDRERGVLEAADSAGNSPFQIPLDAFEESWRRSDFAMTSLEDAPYDVLGMTMQAQLGPSADTLPLDGLPSDGDAALGDWWASSGSPTGCCMAPAEPADTPLRFTDRSGSVYELTGMDTTGTGQADVATLDANADGRADTWVFDTTGTGQADLLYYDSTGTGGPDSVSHSADDGRWAEPMPLSTALDWAPTTFSILSDTPAPTIGVDPGQAMSSVMAPAPEQANALADQGTYWPDAGPLGLDILDLLRNGPRPSSGDVFEFRANFQQAITGPERMGSAFLTPTGTEMRFNSSTGTNTTVSRTSWSP